ncbi:MAG: YciI family protein [Acidimicrobiales bacterium]|jgi:hypothetical protein|nr:hypothetical protein [Acidimicrobiaceae bacterium]MDP6323910.1 YciI family protein [Acidimicrobiales bacterium]MDP6894852.1 YciI family protein [Acidimicrobiales bacterium]HJM38206.1 YciI family protein [Acidimicrobiales bacterium]
MLFAIYALDKENSFQLRMNNRENHLKYLANSPLVFAGPLLDDDEKMCGSLIILEMDDISQVKDFAANDPYAVAGLFKNVEIKRFVRAFPRDETDSA